MVKKKHPIKDIRYCQLPHHFLKEFKVGEKAYPMETADSEGNKQNLVICQAHFLMCRTEARRIFRIAESRKQSVEIEPTKKDLERIDKRL